jgi:hypothetical protein
MANSLFPGQTETLRHISIQRFVGIIPQSLLPTNLNMSNISPALLSTSEAPPGGQLLEIDQTEDALVSWLQKQAREIVSAVMYHVVLS